jgi:ABC-type phosphate transport system substrate-binding protein
MKAWTLRGIASAAAIAMASTLSMLAPGAASAASCTGTAITGQGASLEAGAQSLWTTAFDKNCTAPAEQVTYKSSSSGPAMASWNLGKNSKSFVGYGAGNAFIATDQPPNATETAEILEKGGSSPGSLLEIPVLQGAITLPIHLPTGCTATSGKKKKLIKRLVLSDAQLEGIFAHTITTWAELVNPTNDYNEDALVGSECDSSEAITRVVRAEGAGIVAILDKFLYEINKNPVDGSENWNQLAEQPENTKWPAESEDLVKAVKGSGVVKDVAEKQGTIGEANLFEVRANTAFVPAPTGTGGEGTALFWPELQSKKKKFEDPASNGEADAKASSNCANEDYVSLNGVGKTAKFPPASTEVPWNEVVASTTQKASYPLCGFGYVLSLTKFSLFSEPPGEETTAAEVETVKNYLTYVLSSEGQTALNTDDYLALPSGKKLGKVLEIAQEGAADIAF